MKKPILFIAFCFIALFMSASTRIDTTGHPDLAGAGQQGVQAIITVLSFFGVNIPVKVSGLIIFGVGFILRIVERRSLKKTIAEHTAAAATLNVVLPPHRSLWQKFLDRFRKKQVPAKQG